MQETLELLLQLIEKEDVYHEKKETMAWIAGTLYFTFCIFTVAWLPDALKTISMERAWIVLLEVVFWNIATVFISLQFRARWDSVSHTNMYFALLRQGKHHKTIKELWDYFENYQFEKCLGSA